MSTKKQLHKFFIRAECLVEGRVKIDGADARQIYSVLRLGPGDKFAAVDGKGCMLTVQISEINALEVVGDIVDTCPLDTEPSVKLTLAAALPKVDKLEFVIQKGTELGVAKYHIISTARTIPKIAPDKVERKLSRWKAIAEEAAEQSCRAIVPEIEGITPLDQLIPSIADYDLAICFWEDEKDTGIKEVLEKHRSAKNILIIVGPEGGFEEKEVKTLVAGGAVTASLGRRVFRCETAAIAASAIVLYEMETQ
ncbi:MAG: RsmE family RNA methyltransferase [Armatimonadota bacterium]